MATKRQYARLMTRLARIERKTDAVVRLLLRQREDKENAVDDAIERLHQAAVSLRRQSAQERRSRNL